MPDVRMPDGTVVRNVPEGTTRAELMRRLGAGSAPQQDVAPVAVPVDAAPVAPDTVPAQQPEDVSDVLAFARAAASRYLDNALGVPQVIANTLFTPPGQMVEPLQDPVNTDDLVAAALTLGRAGGSLADGEMPAIGTMFEQSRAEAEDVTRRMREGAPLASLLGDMAGDAGSLVTGRAPLARALRNKRVATEASKAADISNLPPGVRRLLDRTLKGGKLKALKKGAGKAGEAGIEGATLAILNGGDPLETGAYAAGVQVGGSLGLTALGAATTRGGKLSAGRIAMTAGTLLATSRLAQEFGPGENNIFEAADEAFNTMMWGITVGALSGAAGAGRVRGNFADDLPVIADAITALPRGAVESYLSSLTKDGEGDLIGPVVGRLAEDPLYFGADAGRRLERAMKNGNLPNVVRDLRKNKAFTEKLDALLAASLEQQ